MEGRIKGQKLIMGQYNNGQYTNIPGANNTNSIDNSENRDRGLLVFATLLQPRPHCSFPYQEKKQTILR